MKRPILAAALSALVVSSAGAAAASRGDLSAFLLRAQRMSAPTKPVRADIEITLPDSSTATAVLILVPGEPGNQFFEAPASGWRSLMPLGWSAGRVVRSKNGKPQALGPDDRLAGTDFRAMDFFPFWTSNVATAFVSDETRTEKTVSLYAGKTEPYSLYVVTFDKTKLVPVVTKYYRDNFSNLVRLRTDSDYVMVGARPMPAKIVIHDYPENSTTTFELNWRVLDAVPAGLTGADSFYETSLE